MWTHLLFRSSPLDYNLSSPTHWKMSAKSKGWGCKKMGETSQKKSPTGSRADWKKKKKPPYKCLFNIFLRKHFLIFLGFMDFFLNKIPETPELVSLPCGVWDFSEQWFGRKRELFFMEDLYFSSRKQEKGPFYLVLLCDSSFLTN